MKRIALALSSLLLTIGAPALSKDEYVYGPAPDWTRYKELGAAAVLQALPDASGWQVEWPNGYIRFHSFKGRVPGYMTCGILHRSTLAPDGPSQRDFLIVIDHDAVKKIELGEKVRNGIVNLFCPDMVKHGRLPPARMMDAPVDTSVARLGVTIRVTLEGAYVVATSSSSPPKLVPGTVIPRANGVALAGLGQAIVPVLSSEAPSLSLETAAGDTIVAAPR